jgi:hypothetical protein
MRGDNDVFRLVARDLRMGLSDRSGDGERDGEEGLGSPAHASAAHARRQRVPAALAAKVGQKLKGLRPAI